MLATGSGLGRIARMLGPAAIALVFVACAGAKGPAAREGTTVNIQETEFAFEPKTVSISAGNTTFVVHNSGQIDHNVVIQDQVGKDIARIAVISPNATDRLTVNLSPGSYTMYCSLPGHREAGMVGTINVSQ